MTNIPGKQESFQAGQVILLDKPYKWTSFDIVNKIKSLLRHRLDISKIKIGHAGTLDPLATGLLIICTGKFTKQIEKFQELDKTYTGTFFLGKTTPSFDLETTPGIEYPVEHITKELIEKIRQSFLGEQKQIPPLYSAKKIEGERAYNFARKGKQKTLNPVNVIIKEFEITRVEMPEVDFKITCSKGTYIRSLANDFGIALNSKAYLKSLRRTRIGEYDIKDATSIENFERSL